MRVAQTWYLAPSRTRIVLRLRGWYDGGHTPRLSARRVKHENDSHTQEQRRRCGTESKGARGFWPPERLRLIATPLRLAAYRLACRASCFPPSGGEPEASFSAGAAPLRAEPPTRASILLHLHGGWYDGGHTPRLSARRGCGGARSGQAPFAFGAACSIARATSASSTGFASTDEILAAPALVSTASQGWPVMRMTPR